MFIASLGACPLYRCSAVVLAAVGMPECACHALSLLPQDYPSLSMIVAKLQEFHVYPIFAVSNASTPARAAEIYQMYQVRRRVRGEVREGGGRR